MTQTRDLFLSRPQILRIAVDTGVSTKEASPSDTPQTHLGAIYVKHTVSPSLVEFSLRIQEEFFKRITEETKKPTSEVLADPHTPIENYSGSLTKDQICCTLKEHGVPATESAVSAVVSLVQMDRDFTPVNDSTPEDIVLDLSWDQLSNMYSNSLLTEGHTKEGRSTRRTIISIALQNPGVEEYIRDNQGNGFYGPQADFLRSLAKVYLALSY